MPRIADITRIDGTVWVKLETFPELENSLTIWTEEEKNHIIRLARAEALEEAAAKIEVILPNTNKDFAAGKRWCAAAIRNLK